MSLTLSRRDFLKLAGTTAFFASLDWNKIVQKALAAVKSGSINIVWFEAQDCAGNTTAIIQATEPDLVTVLGGKSNVVGPGAVRLLFHETVMLSWGEKTPSFAEKLLHMTPEELKKVVESIPADDPLRKTLETLVSLGYNPGALFASPIDILKLAEEGKLDPFVLVLEGSIPVDSAMLKMQGITDVPEWVDLFCYIGEEQGKVVTCAEWMRRLLKRAVAVVAVGNCASYGGLVANKVIEADFMKKMGYDLFEKWTKTGWSPSPTGAVGFFPDPVRGFKGFVDLAPEAEPFRKFIYGGCTLKPGEVRADCRPAVAVPGCPANGNAQLRVLANLVLWAQGQLPLPKLDQYWRPEYIYGRTVHEQCPRAATYAAGDFRKNPGDNDYRCLFAVGCKGPISNCPWNKFGWVGGEGGPTRTGGVCIGCTMPGFTDAFEPFYKPLPAPEKPTVEATVAGTAAALVAGGVLAYAVSKMVEKKAEKAREAMKG